MTITQNPTAPLVAVVGATGTQGGSVVKALAESDRLYRIRAFTRDAAKPAAQELINLGVEVVVVSLVVDNKLEVFRSFDGADIAFLVTNFWEHLDMDREIAEGKLLIDAAKAAGVSRIVWSGLSNVSKLSAGKYVHAYHFDGKAIVTEYARESGVPFVDVQAGFYGTNFLTSPVMLRKQDDGSFAMPLLVRPTTVLPFIDTAEDYGIFVRAVVELPVFPDGSEFLAHGETITVQDMALQLSQATGKSIVAKQISLEEFKATLEAVGLPPHIVLDQVDTFQFVDEFGWETTPVPEGLARTPRTWAQFVKVTDWSKALA
ncbi:NAD(P)-binding protein [Mycena rosella]|uniref:NAD(P)-binding protein n=1 Tax=Mycena rosella TaxID=1033263 RepID=A0AAD7G661_MYCRO|nr:NAD(P)-binding protein [Mycena rosella]